MRITNFALAIVVSLYFCPIHDVLAQRGGGRGGGGGGGASRGGGGGALVRHEVVAAVAPAPHAAVVAHRAAVVVPDAVTQAGRVDATADPVPSNATRDQAREDSAAVCRPHAVPAGRVAQGVPDEVERVAQVASVVLADQVARAESVVLAEPAALAGPVARAESVALGDLVALAVLVESVALGDLVALVARAESAALADLVLLVESVVLAALAAWAVSAVQVPSDVPVAQTGAVGRPGVAAGGVGGPASGIGVRPGVGAGAAGVGIRPGVGVGGPDSGIGVLPGAGAGLPGAPVARAANGTYYGSAANLAAQTNAVRAATVTSAAYSNAMYANYENAWTANRLTSESLYSHPGYAALATGLGLAAQPVPYDYGGNVVAQSSAIYVNGDAAGTPEEYYSQATQIAAIGAEAEDDKDAKWLPLGVFAIVEGDATSSNDVFQLAVNQKGVIRGNYHNLAEDQVDNLVGSVDTKTQRAAWTIGSDKLPVYEAGIANLTKDATPILVHLGDGQTKQMNLIRLAEPEQE